MFAAYSMADSYLLFMLGIAALLYLQHGGTDDNSGDGPSGTILV